MTVQIRHLVRAVIGLVVVGFVVGALSVEAVTRAEVTSAKRVLPDALARTVAPQDAGRAAVEQLAAARRHIADGQPAAAAHALEQIVAVHPTAELHALAARAWYAAQEGKAAARHAQLAARLAPDDATLAAFADSAVDAALAWRLRPVSRPLGILGGLALLTLIGAALIRRRERKRLDAFLDEVRGRVVFQTDAGPSEREALITPQTESMTVDVFFSGRYGMACPKRPDHAPTLKLVFSHAGSSRTLRLRPIRGVRDSAVRIPIRRETLETLKQGAGRWRLHVQLARRPVASAMVRVESATKSAPLQLA